MDALEYNRCLVTGPCELVKIIFKFADDELAVEDLLIGLPVLQNLGVDTKNFQEERGTCFIAWTVRKSHQYRWEVVVV